MGVGWNHTETQKWGIELGGNIRTGFEDTLMVSLRRTQANALKISRGKYASSNAELVKHLAHLAQEQGRVLATPKQARTLLGLSE